MDPTPANVSVFMFPTAICTPNPSQQPNPNSPDWSISALNPKNRICTLEPPPRSLWEIDGVDEAGTRFYAIPRFARGRPPLRIDVFIPEIEDTPLFLRDVLWPRPSMFHKRDGIETSSISRHILRALEHWSGKIPDFEQKYHDVPYGSRIIVENITANVTEMKISLDPVYATETHWLTLGVLQDLWGFSRNLWPDLVDFDKLQLQRQLHDTVSLVSISGKDNFKFVFKSLTGDIKHMYHEMKLLLTMEPYPNVISRPLYLVIKKCMFGKRGVCGMILEYHTEGTLHSLIEGHGRSTYPPLHDSISWARQITSAIIHIQEKGPGFYTNLKLENIVMTSEPGSTTKKAVLIDFEQRLGSPLWSPPEVHYVSYLIQLATRSPDPSFRINYSELLQSHNISTANLKSSGRYENPEHGYCGPWAIFTPQEQESAQVFMLGKLLWCIFENRTFLNTYIEIEALTNDTEDIRFPEFRRTPQQLRDCILRCTAGSEQRHGRLAPITIFRDKIYPIGCEGDDSMESIEMAQVAIREWWTLQIADAERFLRSRQAHVEESNSIHTNIRPTLKEVSDILTSL